MTWDQLIAMEPRLLRLYEHAKNCKPTKGFCADQVWYGRGGLKAQMAELVGFGSDGALGTPEAYDIAYRKIYNVLPDCRHKGAC